MATAIGERVRGAGYKLTRPRQEVLAALQAAGRPLTAQEVAGLAGTSLASTYRVLGLLGALGMVTESADAGNPAATPQPSPAGSATGVQTEDRSRRYTLCSTVGHHHHFVCRSCHAALDIASDTLERALARAAAELERGSGLRIESHELTLRGECAACHGKGAR